MNVLDMEGKKVLVRLEVCGSSNLTNIVIGEPASKEVGSSSTSRKVALSHKHGGKELMKVTIQNPTPIGKLAITYKGLSNLEELKLIAGNLIAEIPCLMQSDELSACCGTTTPTEPIQAQIGASIVTVRGHY